LHLKLGRTFESPAEQGVKSESIERSGLVVKKDSGGFYDRFRGRLMFPVMDAQGRAIAFGGRTMSPDGEPKYLNSPETAAYIKGHHFYGLNITREEIRKKKFAILVEGYLDLLIPFQHGVRNIIASLGTALTSEQAKLAARFARKIVVNYDGDRAGINAAKRAIETLLAEDIEVKVLVLPDNADPDEFIRKHGADEYHKKRGEALHTYNSFSNKCYGIAIFYGRRTRLPRWRRRCRMFAPFAIQFRNASFLTYPWTHCALTSPLFARSCGKR